MVLANGEINIIADMEGTTGVKLHNNRQKLRARFDILRKLGQGTYGKVQLAVNKDTGEEVAIKTIKKSKIETEQDLIRIQREIQIMSSVQHPHIIHIYEVFENKEKIVLVMEYASGGELYDYLSFKKVLVEAEARRVFRQVASAVFYCHKNMICHRDLKLENILLDERGNAKIADFGLSNVFDDRNFLSTFCGSPLYASPEIVRGTPYYGPEVDCWSLGVLLYTLVYGAMPFDGSNFKRLVKQISEGDYYEPRVPSEASGLIRKMLTVDPAKRANVDDICCDRWVDIGESVPLLDMAEELCTRMPVRLDYLLALTAAPPPPEEVENAKNAAAVTVPDVEPVTQEQTATKDGKIEPVEDDEDADQWERPALQALAVSDARIEEAALQTAATTEDAGKKHKLLSSSSAVDDGSSAQLLRKKKKHSDEVQSTDDDDKGGGAEKIIVPPVELAVEPMDDEANLEPPSAVEAQEVSSELKDSAESNDMVAAADNLQSKAAPSSDVKVPDREPIEDKETLQPATEPEPVENVPESKQTSDKELTKCPTSTAKKPAVGTVNGSVKTKKSGPEVASADGPKPAAAASKVPKLRKSVSVSKDSGSVTLPVAEAPAPLSAGAERRKLVFPSTRVSDAKKSFETKTADKKPQVIPGTRVSSVKKSFEVQPLTSDVTPQSATTSKPLTKSATTATNGVPTRTAITKSASLSKNVEAVTDGPDQAKQPSRTATRMPSPTKGVRSTTADPGVHHHRSCLPPELKTATSAQDAKKSPPKSLGFKRRSPPVAANDGLVRKNSMSKIGSPATKPAKEVSAPTSTAVRRPSGGSSRAGSGLLGPRPRSPTKTFKGKSGEVQPVGLPPKPDTEAPVPEVADVNSKPSEVADVDSKPSEVADVDSKPSEVADFDSKPSEVADVYCKSGEVADVDYKSGEVAPAEEIVLRHATEEKPKDTERHLEAPEVAMVSNEKRGSIEIAPLPQNALVRRYSDDDSSPGPGAGGPVVRFLPKEKSGLVLLGVKSEVMFDVASGEAEPVAPPPTESEQKSDDIDEDSKVIRYVATVRRHGSTDDQLEEGPERVTLLDLRCSASGDVTTKVNPRSSDVSEAEKAVSPTAPKNVEEQFAKIDPSADDNTGPEQRGYSVYRSKYRSVQKYRSVVERRQDDDGSSEKRHVSETVADVGDSRTPSVERCDSFSSAGSADDLEDVFESLTSESLFTSLLSRTRNLIERLTEGDVHATRWFQSSLLGRSAAGSSIPAASSSIVFNSPSISFRLTPGSTSRPSTYRITASSGSAANRSSSLRHHRSGDYESDAASYASDSGSSSRRSSKWKYTPRSTNWGDDDDVAFMSDTGGSSSGTSRLRSNINLRSRSSYSNYHSNRSVSVSSSTSLQANEDLTSGRQSRYEAFRSQEPSSPSLASLSSHSSRTKGDARSDVISALLRHRNRSLDTRRPHSFYDPEPNVADWTAGRSSTSASRFSQSEPEREPPSSLYATTRRPSSRFQRYSKSVTKELSEEYDSEESGLHRPHSVLVLSDAKDGAGSSVSVSRDYSRNVSCSGGTECEEEEEYEHEHRVTEEGGRVTTRRRECKRSVSQIQDGSREATVAGVRQPIKKQGSGDDDHLSRQDSGVGSSMYESTPSTPTSAGTQPPRKAFPKFGHNELESLDEEISRFGLGRRQHEQSNGSDAGAAASVAANSTDGTVTPPSDSAETASVCSDTANADHHPQKAGSEEESVGERIRRKSFFARFNESRIPGLKSRKTSPSVRSELGRSPSLRHHFYDDEPGFGRTLYDASADLYAPPPSVNRGQRWSTHLGDSDFLYSPGDAQSPSASAAPRRRGSSGANPDVLSFLRREPAYGTEDCCEPGMMYRTHSLPEEPNPPSRPVFRQHSMPGSKSADAADVGAPPGAARRPSRLRLHTRNYPAGEEASDASPTDASAASAPPRAWRSGRPRPGGFLDPLETWDTVHPRAGSSFAALMDSLESPSEVLQKAMDLCDSLRFS